MANKVYPIKDLEKMKEFERALSSFGDIYEDIFIIGNYLMMRVTDLLSITYEDIYGKDELRVVESKKGKTKVIPLNERIKDRIASRRQRYPHHKFLFEVESNRAKCKPISRQSVWRVYKQAAERVGIKDNIGTHSHRMNKPYQLYLHDCKIEVISKLLNHSDTKVTLRYLGINEHETNKAYLNDILA